MCYEFSAWFEKARAHELRKEQLRQQQRAQTQRQPQEPGVQQAPPAAEPARPRETVPA